MKLSDALIAEIRHGNTLIISCQGAHACGGCIRVPFSPTLDGAPEPRPATTREGGMLTWMRISGSTIDDLTLSPSINADVCGHFNVVNGQIQ
jgi:hypothetical protein